MSTITNWLIEEGLKFVPSQDSNVGCQNAENSQGNTSGTTQEEPVHKRRKLLSSYL